MKFSNIINLGIRLPLAKITKRRIPFQVHIRLLEQCNQKCTYCIGDYPRRSLKPPTTQQILTLIDGLTRLGTKRITLFGGEPLLRGDIDKIVTHTKSHKIDCALITNGKRIDKHKNILKELDLISFSLDSDKTSHDTYRGEGTWDTTIHAIKTARSCGVPVQLLCTITRLTDPKLTDLLTIAERYDCSVDFDPVHPLFNADGSTTLRPEDPKEEMVEKLLDYHIRHPNLRIALSPHVLKYVRNWPAGYATYNLFYEQIPSGLNPIHCHAGRFSAVIESNGDLVPCCVPRPDYKPVNAFNLGIEKAWQKMPQNNCLTCRSLADNMFNALFSLQPHSLLYFLRNEIKGRFKRVCFKSRAKQSNNPVKSKASNTLNPDKILK